MAVGLLTALMMAIIVPAAGADVRSGSRQFEIPGEAPSLEPRAPITERYQLPDLITASFDSAGSVTLTYRPYSPAAWSGTMPRVAFELREYCDDDGRAPIAGYFQYSTWTADPEPSPGAPPEVRTEAVMQVLRAGYDGRASGTVSYDGHTYTATASHPAFAGLRLRCVSVRGDEGGVQFDDSFWFAGHSPTDYANRKPTAVTVGPYKWSDEVFLRVKPRRFGLWGSSNAESGRFVGFRWSPWGRNEAIGRGYSVALHGHRGKRGRLVFDRWKARIRLSRARLCGETWEFTRMRISTRYGSSYEKIPNAC